MRAGSTLTHGFASYNCDHTCALDPSSRQCLINRRACSLLAKSVAAGMTSRTTIIARQMHSPAASSIEWHRVTESMPSESRVKVGAELKRSPLMTPISGPTPQGTGRKSARHAGHDLMCIREQHTMPLSPPTHKKTRASHSANSRFEK